MFNKKLIFLLFALLVVSNLAQSQELKNTKRVANLWHQIPFFSGGDIGQYQTTMSQDRDGVRQMFWNELMGQLQQLSESGVYVESILEPLANILIKFDQIHDEHKALDIVKIDFSLEQQFKSALDSFFTKYDIRDDQRKIQISRGVNSDLISTYLKESSKNLELGKSLKKEDLDLQKMLQMYDQIDYVSYGTFSSIGNGNFQLTFHIIGSKNGISRNFISQGPLVDALNNLAFQLFNYFQANVYEEWKSPYSQLIWLPMPINSERQKQINMRNYNIYSFNEAKSYCQARGFRLPYAKEIVMAETGTNYKEGGISALYPFAKWAVADRRATNENNWIIPANADATGGVFMADGISSMKGVFWCVRGTVSKDVLLADKVWSLLRRFRNNNLEVYRALQTVRFEMADYDAKSSELLFWNGNFVTVEIYGSLEEALDVLRMNGISIND